MVTNEFYSISENIGADDSLELSQLKAQQPGPMFGNTHGFKTSYYRNTTAEDYDRDFAYKLVRIKPPYDCDKLLDFHYSHYLSKPNSAKSTFLKHMKYVVLPILKKINGTEVYIELLNEWIQAKQEAKSHFKANSVMNNININGVNGNLQVQQNSNNSPQTIESFAAKDYKELFKLIRTDIHSSNLNTETIGEFHDQLEKAMNSVNKNEDLAPILAKLGSLIQQVGLPVFLNLVSSDIFEHVRHALGV